MERLSPEVQPEQALENLARAFLPDNSYRDTEISLHALKGDAGFRRYFRMSPDTGWLGVFAPPGKEDLAQFLQVARLFSDQGLKVPRVLVADLQSGFALVEDWGDCLYQDRLQSDTAQQLYGAALESLACLSGMREKPSWLPLFDIQLLQRDMHLFRQWFVGSLLQYSMSGEEERLLDIFCQYLVQQALEQPSVLVHRDFHCRNLMDVGGHQPGLIDFQDAVWGPITYDLASLCRDYYVRWSPARVQTVVADYAESLSASGRISASQQQNFAAWFEAMSAQRHLKVLGIFARLNLRDGKAGYLDDLPLVIRYLMETTGQIPAACEFRDWFARHLIPLAEQQPWYRDWQTAGDQIEVW